MEVDRTFDSVLIGAIFSINDLADVGDELPDEAWEGAYAVNHDAYKLIEQQLPQHASWFITRDGDQLTPFELCEESYEIEGVDGLAGFNVWVYGYQNVDEGAILALAREIDNLYQQAAAKHGATAKLLSVHVDVKEQVTTRRKIEAAALS